MIWSLFVALAAQPSKRPSDAERGEELYRRHCQACHGVSNDGTGPLSAALVHPVPALAGTLPAKGDERFGELVRVILKGREAMPAYEATFDAADARRVLGFMAGLSPESPLGAPKPKATTKKKPVPDQGEQEPAEDEEDAP